MKMITYCHFLYFRYRFPTVSLIDLLILLTWKRLAIFLCSCVFFSFQRWPLLSLAALWEICQISLRLLRSHSQLSTLAPATAPSTITVQIFALFQLWLICILIICFEFPIHFSFSTTGKIFKNSNDKILSDRHTRVTTCPSFGNDT